MVFLMKNKTAFLLLGLIFVIGIFLRFYKLGQIPPSLDWDEASIGYNAYTILRTAKDEYGNKLPISIRSFNDYKASVYVYLSTIPIALFGLNEFSVRFISALFGSLTVLLAYFLIKQLLSLDKRYKNNISIPLLTSFFLAISPWHIQFSRVAFEANLSLFFFISGFLLLLLAVKKNFYLPFSALFFGTAMLTYHSAKIVVPVFVIGLLFIFKRKLFRQKIYFLSSFLLAVLFAAILIYGSRLGGSSRLVSTSVFGQSKTILEAIRQIIANYLIHFDFNFLFIKGDPQARHHVPGLAQLYLWELPFVIIGIVFLLKDKLKGRGVIFWWFLSAPIAAALTTDVPNAVRSLLFLPSFQFFAAFGIYSIYSYFKNRIFAAFFYCFVVLLAITSFAYYYRMYFIHYPLENSQDWQYGYKQAVNYVNKHKNEYQKIIVTDFYDQPYIYFLFYQQPLKIMVNNGEYYKGFNNLQFRPINWAEDSKMNNALLIGTGEEIPLNDKTIEEIKFLDGEVAFRISGL